MDVRLTQSMPASRQSSLDSHLDKSWAIRLDKNPKYERWRRQIFAVTWLAYAGFYLTRKAFSVAKNELKKPEIMGMTRDQMSWIDGGNSVAYALGQFLFGTLGDKLGTRAIVLAGMLGSVIVALATGCSSSVLLIGVFFAIQGLCQ